MKNEFECYSCYGSGEAECPHCNQDMTCEECDGSGLDSERIDIAAFQSAAESLFEEEKTSWAAVEDGAYVGRTNGKRTVYYRDFAK